MTSSLRVLMYHRVIDPGAAPCSPSLVSATPRAFEEQARLLARRYRVLSLDEVVDLFRRLRPLPPRAVLITFDDGCADFGEIAWPILRRHRLPATVFVPTAYPGRPERNFWWDRLHAALSSTQVARVETPEGPLSLADVASKGAALRSLQRLVKTLPHHEAMQLVDRVCRELGDVPAPSDVLPWNRLRALAADGVAIGAHTRTHPALTRLATEEARAEIRGSAGDLRRELGACPPVFAYPFGDHDDRIVRIVREEGFELAFTTRDGHSRLGAEDPLRLRRTGVTPRTTARILRARLTFAGGLVDRWRHHDGRSPEAGSPSPRPAPLAPPAPRVAYIMSRFPKLSETFVLNEMVACEAQGVPVELFPLLRERQAVAHPEVDAWIGRARFQPFVSPAIIASNFRFLREQPRRYVGLLGDVLRETWGSANFFVGALGIFPKSVRFAEEMRLKGVTHVHAHFATHPALSAFIVHRLTGIPFSFTAHGSDLHVERRMLDRKVEAAAFAVTVSAYNRDVILRECGAHVRDKVHVVHCGVDPEVFRPASGRRRGIRPFRLVCVASFEEVKGHRYLVDACRLLRDRSLDFECDLVGEGPLRRTIEARAQAAGLGGQLHFLGGLPRPQVARLLAEADAAVLASHPTRGGKREGIPVALMEAMAAGLPVVATAISGIPELVQAGVTGFLVPSADPVALAGALERLGADGSLRHRMGTAGRAKVEREFNLRVNTARLAQLFASPSVGPVGPADVLPRAGGNRSREGSPVVEVEQVRLPRVVALAREAIHLVQPPRRA
jgi:glycosyltransferase involved in cell wall biosynthesis/peptidoglycan/xylan/chitin deacetylase (PgdA/CDA1 family)